MDDDRTSAALRSLELNEVRWQAILDTARVIVPLGQIGWDAVLRVLAGAGEPVPRPRPRFGHGAEGAIGERILIGSYHPGQQNTFTGKLTAAMFIALLGRARDLAGLTEIDPPSPG